MAFARAQGAARVVLAAPVAPPDAVAELERDTDEVVCLETQAFLRGIGQFYEDFPQTPDEEVVELLARATGPLARVTTSTAPASPPLATEDPPIRDEEVEVTAAGARLWGRLTVPCTADGLVVFVHGSGSSRNSPRNRFVADVLVRAGFGTLLFDLLTPEEGCDRENVFDIELLARRLGAVTSWLRERPQTSAVHIGYLGASTGAAAALWAAADESAHVAAVVSRGGRPDMAGPRLAQVRAPTLLIVGGQDEIVLELNRKAKTMLRCESRLAIVPGATHLFEEPGTLQAAADVAKDWFVMHLRAAHPVP